MTEWTRWARAPSLLLTALLLGVSGCGPVEEKEAERPSSLEWTEEGLYEQPRLQALREGVPESLEYEPGTTSWRPAAASPVHRSLAIRTPETPGELLAQVALARGFPDLLGEGAWEQTMRIWSSEEGEAVGVVLQWGLLDDAVAGRDLRVTMRRVERAWEVVGLEERFHCRRGVSPEGLCL